MRLSIITAQVKLTHYKVMTFSVIPLNIDM